MKYTGQLVTGDFEDNTMTFEIDGEMILQAGKYSIEQIQVGNQVKNLDIADVSYRREQLEAFVKQLKEDNEFTEEINFQDINKFLASNCR